MARFSLGSLAMVSREVNSFIRCATKFLFKINEFKNMKKKNTNNKFKSNVTSNTVQNILQCSMVIKI